MTSCYEVYKGLGYPKNSLYSYDGDDEGLPSDADEYYLRDWYFFSIKNFKGVSYGMVMLRPFHNDSKKPSAVAVSFVELDTDAFSQYDVDKVDSVKEEIVNVTECPNNVNYSEHIVDYIADPSTTGNYELTEEYIKVVTDSEISSNEMVAIIPCVLKSDYRDEYLEMSIDYEGFGIYSAEINFHAIALLVSVNAMTIHNIPPNMPISIAIDSVKKYSAYTSYDHAIKADLSLGHEKVYKVLYKNYDGIFVSLQRDYHGIK